MQGHFYKPKCKCLDKKKCACGASWVYVVDIGIDPKTGKRKQKKKMGFKKKQDAVLAAAEVTRQNIIRMENRDTYYDKDFIFTKEKDYLGYPEIVKTIENRMSRLLKIAGLNTSLTPHSLRHTHTSLLAEAGVSLPEIMERLGHKDDETTRLVYMHTTKAMKKEASQKFSELMKNL